MSVTALSGRTASKRDLPAQVWSKPAAASSTSWTRPAEWLTLPDISAQQRAVGIVAIYPDANFLAVTAAGNYTVDWGDGTVQNFNSGVTAYREYTYSSISNAGENALGYRQVLVQIYPQAGSNLTSLNFNVRHNRSGLNSSYVNGWRELSINSSTLTTLSIGTSSAPGVSSGLMSVIIGAHALTNYVNLFSNCVALQSVVMASSSATVTSTSSMFNNCASLTSVPLFNTASVSSMFGMFGGCRLLTSVPLFDTSSVTNMSSMFLNCSSLTTVPLFNTSAVTSMNQMFLRCNSLTTVPLFNTSAVNDMFSAFSNCNSLTSVPLFNTSATVTMTNMLFGCASLKSVPLFNTSAATSMSGMFNGCTSLTSVPLLNTSSVTNMSSMFMNCSSLATVPLFDTSSVTSMIEMFSGCYSLTTVPLFNTASVTNMSYMFRDCYSLTTVPLFNTASVNSMRDLFNGCYALNSVPLLNTAAVTNMQNMFSGCASLKTVPVFNTTLLNNMTLIFNGCSSLMAVPLFNTSAVNNMVGAFNGCTSLAVIPALNCTLITSAANMPSFTASVSVCNLANLRATVSFNGCRLSTTQIGVVCNNVTAGSTGRTLTLTGNYGLGTVSRANYGTTAGSATVTQPFTSSLAVGMLVTGTNINTAVAVTFQDASDTVTRTAHGLANGTQVAFASITSTTGVVVYTPYFVVNATSNTFQVSDTLGGSARALTTDGSGTMIYPSYITAITTNTNITLSAPASATGGGLTLVATVADYSLAQLKGWTVTL